MLSLESKQWSNLNHAYGKAENIPAMIRKLADAPPVKDHLTEPYFTLWSSLCHQGDIYTASYAALPQLVGICSNNSITTDWTVLNLVVAIELARLKGRGPKIPDELSQSYLGAINHIPQIAVDMISNNDCKENERGINICAAAIAISKGYPKQAEAFLELDNDNVDDFLKWHWNR